MNALRQSLDIGEMIAPLGQEIAHLLDRHLDTGLGKARRVTGFGPPKLHPVQAVKMLDGPGGVWRVGHEVLNLSAADRYAGQSRIREDLRQGLLRHASLGFHQGSEVGIEGRGKAQQHVRRQRPLIALEKVQI